MNQNNSLNSLLQQGHHQLERGQYEAGLEIFQQADSFFPKNSQVKYGWGLAYFRLEQSQKCIDCLNLALQLQPIYPLALVRRGMVYKALEQTEQANADFEAVLKIKSQTHEDWRARGIAFDELKQPESALECYNKALEIEPESHQSWHNKGLTLQNLQRFDEALKCFERALKILPDRFFSIRSRGDALLVLQRYQEALENYNQALETKPQDSVNLACRGLCLASLGRLQEAIASYDAALEIKSDDFVAWYFKGNALVQLQQYEPALVCYYEALKINPDFQPARKARERLLSEVQNLRIKAYSLLIQALLQCPNGEENQILVANQNLIDAGLIEAMQQVAAEFERQESNNGKWLRNIAQNLVQYLNHSQHSQEHLNFLLEILRTVANKGSQEHIYALLEQNLHLLDDKLAKTLQAWTENTLPTLESEAQQAIGYDLGNLSNCIQNFPRGNRSINLEIAITGYCIIQTVFTQKDFPLQWAMIKKNLGLAYGRRIKGDKANNFEAAIVACQKALTIFTQQDFPVDWAGTNNNLGIAYYSRIQGDRANNLERAIEYYQKALTIFTQQDFPVDWAGMNKNLGLSYRVRIQGDRADNLKRAIEYYQKALTIFTQQDFPVDWAGTNNNLGNAYSDRIRGDRANNLERAIEYYQKALTIFTQQDFPVDWADTNNNLGYIYWQSIRGDQADNLERAIEYYQKALTIFTQQDFPFRLAGTNNNLGLAYFSHIQGDRADNLERAIEYYQKALTIFTQDNSPFNWAMTQNNLGNAYRARIKGDRAENIEQAIAYYQQALTIRTQTDFPIECLQTASNLGNLYFQQGNWRATIEAYFLAIEAVEQSREWSNSDQNKQEIVSNAIAVYQNIVQACINLGQIDKGIEYVERGKARSLVDLLTTRDLYPKGDIPLEVITRLDSLRQATIVEERRLRQQGNANNSHSNPSGGDNRGSTTKASNNNHNETTLDRTHLNSLRQELEKLVEEEIQDKDPSFQLTQRVKPISFEKIKAALPTKQTVLVEWYVGKNTLSAFIVTNQQEQPSHLVYSQEDYQSLIDALVLYLDMYSVYKYLNQENLNLKNLLNQFYIFRSIQQFLASTEIFNFLLVTCYQLLLARNLWRSNLKNVFSQLAQNLQLETIIEQAKQLVPNCNQLILVPHLFLHLLPIHALPLSDGKCLLDLFPQGVSYAPSVQLLELIQKQNQPQLTNFFAVQNPTEDLQFTNIEVQTIRSQFDPNDDVLVKQQATKPALTRERLGQANLAHFSCHGYFNFENPELSALLMAGSKVDKEEGEGENKEDKEENTRFLSSRDGGNIDLEQCLTLGEIFGLDLRNCRLVTLSACETGLTDFNSLSDEYIGLPSGFLYAGSPSVVSSLWTVSDLSTTFLMIKFYQNLQEIDSVPIALNQAQLWLRNLTKKEFREWSKDLPLTGNQRYEIDGRFRENEHPFASPYHWGAFCAVGS